MSTISEALVETELFGQGARGPEDREGARKGVIEFVRGGTLFIDGLKLIPTVAQDKLLKIMEERRIYPVDGSGPVDVDVRMIMGTDTDLKALTRSKKLTEALHRHLSGPIVTLPPLRERMEDVRFLALKFLWKASIELHGQVHELDDDAMDLLMHHSWPGNVRELENTIRRAVLSSDDDVIRPEQVRSIIEGASETAPFPLPPYKTVTMEATGAKTAPKGFPDREESYRQVVQLSPNGIFVCADEQITYANPAFARIIGAKSPEELYVSRAFDFFCPDHLDLLRDALRTVRSVRQKTPPMEQKMVRLDGAVIDVETQAFPFADNGRDAVMVVVEDITGRKKASGETLQNAIVASIKDLVFPYLQKVRRGRLTESQAAYMDMIESGLNHVISPLLEKVKGAYSCFTPTEIQVADMVRSGKTTKEIAKLLDVCTGTIEGHRNSIRKKLGLNNKKTNLQSHLSSM